MTTSFQQATKTYIDDVHFGWGTSRHAASGRDEAIAEAMSNVVTLKPRTS